MNGKQVEVVTVFKLLGVLIECLNVDGTQRVQYKESQQTTVIRAMVEYASVFFQICLKH